MRGGVLTRISVVGSINVDLTSYLERWPGVGETVAAGSTQITLGGKGANQAVAAARLGSQVTMIGAVGKDSFGHDAVADIRAAGVELRVAELPDRSSGMAFIDVGPDGGNIIRLSQGANAVMDAKMVERHADALRQSTVVLLQNEVPISASLAAARIAQEAGGLVIMDPAPAPVPFWSESILKGFDIITPNTHETHLILGTLPTTLDEARIAARALCSSVRRGAIVTMGRLGVAWCIDGEDGQMTAPNVPAIDTVAAGDCFNGALAHGLAAQETIDQAIVTAMDAAAFATTQRGASTSAPFKHQLESFRKRSYSHCLANG